MVALTANPDKAVEWGVDETRILPFDEALAMGGCETIRSVLVYMRTPTACNMVAGRDITFAEALGAHALAALAGLERDAVDDPLPRGVADADERRRRAGRGDAQVDDLSGGGPALAAFLGLGRPLRGGSLSGGRRGGVGRCAPRQEHRQDMA